MLRKIPYLNYSMDIDTMQVFSDDNEVRTTNNQIDGFDITWLKWLVYFQIEIPGVTINQLYKDIRFVTIRANRLIRDDIIIVSTKQYQYLDTPYVYCLRYPDYVVSSTGLIRSLFKNAIVYPMQTDNSYSRVRIYDRSINDYTQVSIHRLVAMAWCNNDDWRNKIVVDHLDGNKHNNAATNLRWVTPSENNKAAIINGLRRDNITCAIENIDTGDIINACSIREACQLIAAPIIDMTQKDLATGVVVCTRLGNFRIKSTAVIRDYNNTGQRWHIKDGVDIYDVIAGVSTTIYSYDECQDLGLSKSTVVKAIRIGIVNRVYANRFMIRLHSNVAWPRPKVLNKNAKVAFNVTDNETQETIVIDSLRQVAAMLGYDKSGVMRRLRKYGKYETAKYTVTFA